MTNKAHRPICYVDGIKSQKLLSAGTYKWRETLQEIQKNSYVKDDKVLKNFVTVVDVSSFTNPPLANFLSVMSPDIKVEVRIHDYDLTFNESDKIIYWIASIKKICGYLLLLRFEGMDQEGDEKFDFWINIGSTDLRHVGFCASLENCELIPPDSIRQRHSDWSKYMVCKLHACKTLTINWVEEQKSAILNGKFKLGNRLELLDRMESTRVRPARVIHQLGRRICVRISAEDMLLDQLEKDDDLQIHNGVWLDENSGLIFPVGWATYNGYGLQSNKAYSKHCQAIADSLNEGKLPSYEPFDVTHDVFKDWKENATNFSHMAVLGTEASDTNPIHWEVGRKLECLDPLNSTFLELRVASCVELLKDGYIKIGFDGPQMEEESLPIHSTSPLLFPAGYGAEYNISVRGPSETTEFSWKEYLRQCQAESAPPVLFDVIPPMEVLKKFQVGGKLEATDMCESHLICPATIVDLRGRLLRIHFDGWPEEFDQLFDYRSCDIFPLGWCEMYGYKLEPPKTESTGPSAKKRKK